MTYWAEELCPHRVEIAKKPFDDYWGHREATERFEQARAMFGHPGWLASGERTGRKEFNRRNPRWICGTKVFWFKTPQDAVLFKLTFG